MKLRRYLAALLVAVPLLLGSPAFGAEYIGGDIDSDGIVRLSDSLLMLRYISGTWTIEPEICAYSADNLFTNCSGQLHPCDVNGDGRCDFSDFALILNKSRGLITF
ncbi:MAG: hypothetical protein FIA91_04400 [Geobacter sp.]|nr:hypothetical protein [Geobacter sp.]